MALHIQLEAEDKSMETKNNGKHNDIMVVDDTPANLQVLVHMLGEKGYKVRPVPDGTLALKAIASVHPDLILLDINMPGLNGYQVCERLKADPETAGIPVIFLSAHTETDVKVKAFTVGGVDYITKPFQIEEVLARVKTHLYMNELKEELKKHNENLQNMVNEQVKEISELQMSTIFAMAKLSEYRDIETGIHLERVRSYCRILGDRLREQGLFPLTVNQRFVYLIHEASPLHDIGKVGVPDAVLLKPGRLTSEEFDIIKTHTTIGAQALEAVRKQYPHNEFLAMGIEIALSHHEKWNGGGYPNGLSGETIPLSARIMAIADVYDALTSKRVYKESMSHEKSIEIISAERGEQFDPQLVDAFIAVEKVIAAVRESYQDKCNS